MGMKTITFDEWYVEEVARMERFRVFWNQKQKEEGKDRFPDELPMGDWDEQCQIFADGDE